MLPTAVSETAACPVAITDNPEFQRLSATLEAKTADIEMHLEDLSAKQKMYEALLAENAELEQRLKQEFERTYGLGFIAGSRGGNQLAVGDKPSMIPRQPSTIPVIFVYRPRFPSFWVPSTIPVIFGHRPPFSSFWGTVPLSSHFGVPPCLPSAAEYIPQFRVGFSPHRLPALDSLLLSFKSDPQRFR